MGLISVLQHRVESAFESHAVRDLALLRVRMNEEAKLGRTSIAKIEEASFSLYWACLCKAML